MRKKKKDKAKAEVLEALEVYRRKWAEGLDKSSTRHESAEHEDILKEAEIEGKEEEERKNGMRTPLKNGEEWIIPNIPGIQFTECCDCGLVHLEYFQKKGKRIVQYSYRDDDETTEIRKSNGIVLYRRKNKREKEEKKDEA